MQPNRSTHSTINAVEGMVACEYLSKRIFATSLCLTDASSGFTAI